MDKSTSQSAREGNRVPAHEKIAFLRWVLRNQHPVHPPVKQLIHYLLSHPLLVQSMQFVSDVHHYQSETTLELFIRDPHPANGFYLQQDGTIIPSHLAEVIRVFEVCEEEDQMIYCTVVYPHHQTCEHFLRVTKEECQLTEGEYAELNAFLSFMEQYETWKTIQKGIDESLQTRDKERFLQTTAQQHEFLHPFVSFLRKPMRNP